MNTLQQLQRNIYELGSLVQQVQHWRAKQQSIVFTNGCFDLLHKGHLHTLSRAADLGHKLIIGLNTDASIRLLKGKNRPIQDEITRASLLAAFRFVDAVALFNTPTPYQLIDAIRPDVLVKGGDYRPDDIVGAQLVKQGGGKVIVIPYIEGISTTEILRKG